MKEQSEVELLTQQLVESRAKLKVLGTYIDQVERELAPKKKEFTKLWNEKNQLEMKLFEVQGKIKHLSIGESGRKSGKSQKIDLSQMSPEAASALLKALGQKEG